MLSTMWSSQHDRDGMLAPSMPEPPRQADEGIHSLGRDFNPLKFDFAPMRQFNPLKFEFNTVVTPERDLLDMLPDGLGPERYVTSPQMGATSHQDVALQAMHGMYDDQPATASLDNDTLSLLHSLEANFAPSSASPVEVQSETMTDGLFPMAMAMEVLQPKEQQAPSSYIGEVDESLADFPSLADMPNTEGLSVEQLRILRNKAVQKRYRMRKKNEALRQSDVFHNTKLELYIAESRSPVRHNQVVDTLLMLRRLNKERDSELKRLRKLLKNEQKSEEVPSDQVMVVDGGEAKEGDFVDDRLEVVIPREVALDVVGEACCRKMVGGFTSNNKGLGAVVEQRFANASSPHLSAAFR